MLDEVVFAEVCSTHFYDKSKVTSDSYNRTRKDGLIPLTIAESWVVPVLISLVVQQRRLQSIWLHVKLVELDLITAFYRCPSLLSKFSAKYSG